MLAATLKESVNKDGEGMKRACKACGIPYTYKAIFAFVGKPVDPLPKEPVKANSGIGHRKAETTVLTGIQSAMTGVWRIDRAHDLTRLTYTDNTTESAEITNERWQELQANSPFSVVSEVQSKRK
jgi:hypothetical protein